MARVKAHVIRVQNTSKLSENDSLGFHKLLAIVYRPIAINMPQDFLRALSSPGGNSLMFNFTIFIIIIIFFFFKPSISIQERVEVLIFSQNGYKFAGGVRGHQAIAFSCRKSLPLIVELFHGEH